MSANDKLQEESWGHRGKRLMAAFAVLAVAVLVMGLTFTWFVGSESASTVAKVREPSKLRILGPNETSIEQVDLSYDSSNIDGDAVTVRRGFCVESGGDAFELQIANTTNISDLSINVYRVTVNSVNDSGDVVESGSYSWNKGDEVSLTTINDSDNDGIANMPTGSSDPTFGNYTNVQANAAPLYRYHAFTTTDLDKKTGSTTEAADVTNFIIELTWTESVKETDIVYLIARNTTTS